MTNEPEASGGTDQYSHHLTIGPHGGVDWVRRLGLEPGGRKSSDSEITNAGAVSGREEELTLHRSTDCIVSKELASSSDSDLLRYERKKSRHNCNARRFFYHAILIYIYFLFLTIYIESF